MKRAEKSGNPPSVGKLLRVLVAGGVALAGVVSVASAADEKTPSETADKTAADKAAADKAAAEKAAAEKSAKGGDKKDKEKPRSDDAGGVKGW